MLLVADDLRLAGMTGCPVSPLPHVPVDISPCFSFLFIIIAPTLLLSIVLLGGMEQDRLAGSLGAVRAFLLDRVPAADWVGVGGRGGPAPTQL